MRSIILDQVVPISGMLMLVAAYFIAFRDPAKQRGRVYIWMNILGSAILAGYAIYRAEPFFFGIEFFWFAISVAALVRRGKAVSGPK